jgi:NAD(P)-dependent dehydrogenase (short-subunit alcohol dehydrogenase family)
MDLQLKDRRALVTGSTAGIGFAIARLLAAEGAQVIVNGRTRARVDDAIARIRGEVPSAVVEGVAADVGTADGCRAIADARPEVDILVNNAGIFAPVPFEQIEDAEWLRFFETNVLSGVRLSRHYVAGMRARGWGRVLFVSSESAVQIPSEMIHYGMTKTAQLAVARGLAETLTGTGVTVNSLLPGPTRSEGVGTFVEQMARERGTDFETMEREFFTHARPSSILQRFATVDEVASMAVYLCSPLASATTGAAVRVDGGVVRAIV